MSGQTIIVILVFAAAAIWLGMRIYNSFSKKAHKPGCADCAASEVGKN